MRTLHLAWMAFFLTFVVWFNAAPLLQAIAADLGVSSQEIVALVTVNVAIAVPARVTSRLQARSTTWRPSTCVVTAGRGVPTSGHWA